MVRLITLISLTLLLLILTGCKAMPAKVEIVEVKTAIIYVPTSPDITPPSLVYDEATPAQRNDAKEAIKLLVIDFQQVYDYSLQLQVIVNKYNELAKDNPDINKLLLDKSITDTDKTKLKMIKEKFDNLFKSEK